MKAFALLAATGDGSGSDTEGQTMTYKVVGASNADLTWHVNKVVEGTLTAKSIRALAPTCAVRSAPDNDKK